MAIYRASDSLSRCDPNQYSSIYDVRKRPDIKHEPVAATRPIHKDTIEISRDKLKEEALNRLRHTSKYVIAQSSFMRIGKYLFLAVALPPYFVIYGLPKWILVEGIPAIFSMSLWIWKRIQHRTQKQIEMANRKVVQMVQLVQSIVQVLMQPIIHLALQIRQSIRQFHVRSLRMFRKIAASTKQMLHLPRMKLMLGLEHVQKRLLIVREKWSKRAQKASIRIQQGIQWVKESPQVIYGWGQIQFQHISQQVLSFSLHWKNHFQTSQQMAQRATDWVVKGVRKGSEWFKRQFSPLINLYQEQWLPRWHQLSEAGKLKWLQTRNFFQHKHQQSLAFLQVMQEKLKRVTSDQILQYILSHPGMGKLPIHFQEWLKKWLSHSLIRAICDMGVKCYTLSANALVQVAKYGLQAIAQGSDFIIKGCNLFRSTIKMMVHTVQGVLKVCLRVFHKSVIYALYYFLLFLTIALILFIWSLRSLGNYTGYLFAFFPLKKRVAGLKG